MKDGLEIRGCEFHSQRRFAWIIFIFMAYFAARLIYFAVTTSPYVPADEVTMLGKSVVFSKYLLLPENTPQSYQYGLVTNIPWLYFWLMGKLLHLNVFGLSSVLFLRLANIPFAFGTIYGVWKLLKLFTDDRLTQVLLVVAMTNTLMFSFLSSNVSYDNLTNLLAALAIYHLFAFFINRSGTNLATSILCLMAGCLTKATFIPIALIIFILLIARESRNIAFLPSALANYSRTPGKVLLSVLILVCLALNIQLYGVNLMRYKVAEPRMEQVVSLENAMQYRLTARNYIFEQFKERRISIEQAWDMASRIPHTGDRLDTIGLVNNYAMLQQTGFKPMGLLTYSGFWFFETMSSFFGIKSHMSVPNEGFGLLALVVSGLGDLPDVSSLGFSCLALSMLILISAIAFFMRWRPWDMQWLPTYLVIIAVSYGLLLMYKINYQSYLNSREVGLTVAGRYLFPVIGPIYVLSSLYLMRLFKGRNLRLALALLATIVLVFSDFPYFMMHVTPGWYIWTQG